MKQFLLYSRCNQSFALLYIYIVSGGVLRVSFRVGRPFVKTYTMAVNLEERTKE